jgi:hypothetical protein
MTWSAVGAAGGVTPHQLHKLKAVLAERTLAVRISPMWCCDGCRFFNAEAHSKEVEKAAGLWLKLRAELQTDLQLALNDGAIVVQHFEPLPTIGKWG